MKQQKKMVKEDINFLECPNWVLNRRSSVDSFTIDKPNGRYEIKGLHGLPSHFDKVVLYSLIHKLYRENALSKNVVVTTRYEITKNIFGESNVPGKNQYHRIMLALNKWTDLSIKFEGTFYEGDGYTFRSFHVINEFKLQKETGALTVEFNASYLKQLAETAFYILIDFDQYRKLQRASSARLYEILIKTFKERTEWAINIQLLAEKLTFEQREGAKTYYPSDVLRHLKPAINEINKKTDLHIKMDFNKETQVLIFKSLPQKTKAYTPAVVDKTDKESGKARKDLLKKFHAMSPEEQEFIRASCNENDFYKHLPDENERIFAWMKQHVQQKQ